MCRVVEDIFDVSHTHTLLDLDGYTMPWLGLRVRHSFNVISQYIAFYVSISFMA